MAKADSFYAAYATGDASQARQSLLLGIQFIQSPKAESLSAYQRAIYLFGYCARLYVLEKKVGNRDDAEAALVRARYWQLESYVSSEDGWTNRVSLQEFLSHNTSDNIIEIVEKLDKPANGGKGPRYNQQ